MGKTKSVSLGLIGRNTTWIMQYVDGESVLEAYVRERRGKRVIRKVSFLLCPDFVAFIDHLLKMDVFLVNCGWVSAFGGL